MKHRKSLVKKEPFKPCRRYKVSHRVNHVSSSPCGKQFLAAGRDVLFLMDVNLEDCLFTNMRNLTRKRKRNLICKGANVVSWHPSVKERFLTGTTDGNVVVWTYDRGNLRQDSVWRHHCRLVSAARWCPDESNIVLSASNDRTIRLWDVRTNPDSTDTTLFCTQRQTAVRDAHFSPFDGIIIASTHDSGDAKLWDRRMNNAPIMTIYQAHEKNCGSMSWNTTELNVLATASGYDNTIKIWDIGGTEPVCRASVQSCDSTKVVKFRPGSKHQLACTCSAPGSPDDLMIYVWDYRSRFVPELQFKGHTGIVTDFEFLNTESLAMISCSDDQSLQLHNSTTQGIRPLDNMPLGALDFSPNHTLVSVEFPRDLSRKSTKWTVKEESEFRPTTSGTKYMVCRSVLPNCRTGDTNELDVFRQLMEGYRIEGEDFEECCDHNAAVCLASGLEEIAELWDLLKTVFTMLPEIPSEAEEASRPKKPQSKQPSPRRSSSESIRVTNNNTTLFSLLGTPTDMPTIPSEDEDEDEMPADDVTDQERRVMQAALPDIERDPASESLLVRLDHECAAGWLSEVLDDLLETAEVQTACVILGLLARFNIAALSKDRKECIFSAYIELLQRREYDIQACKVLRHAPETIKNCYKGQTFRLGCGQCGTGIVGPRCLKGCKPTLCAVCEMPCALMVYTCSRCGHGGHTECLADFFSQYTFCPSGCGCYCQGSQPRSQQPLVTT